MTRQHEVLRARLDDAARVQALVRLGVLDQPPAADLDGLTRLATFVTGAPVGIINLLDATRQWQASVTGQPRGVFRREDSLCQYTVADNALVHVADASKDRRFAGSPFVDGTIDSIRFYCGVPVRDVAGFPVGTLCVTDSTVRELRPGQVAALHDLAAQVEHLFELRRLHGQLVELLTEVDHFATHDPLTGAVNRRLLMDRLDHAIARADRSGTAPTVIFCDLDGFKSVNDAHGHQAGDETLRTVAGRLSAAVRPEDTVARIGG
ncbi:MAG TPA: sensor domain-containing diguanylate cyclase, partial [Actinomycetales bacterium]